MTSPHGSSSQDEISNQQVDDTPVDDTPVDDTPVAGSSSDPAPQEAERASINSLPNEILRMMIDAVNVDDFGSFVATCSGLHDLSEERRKYHARLDARYREFLVPDSIYRIKRNEVEYPMFDDVMLFIVRQGGLPGRLLDNPAIREYVRDFCFAGSWSIPQHICAWRPGWLRTCEEVIDTIRQQVVIPETDLQQWLVTLQGGNLAPLICFFILVLPNISTLYIVDFHLCFDYYSVFMEAQSKASPSGRPMRDVVLQRLSTLELRAVAQTGNASLRGFEPFLDLPALRCLRGKKMLMDEGDIDVNTAGLQKPTKDDKTRECQVQEVTLVQCKTVTPSLERLLSRFGRLRTFNNLLIDSYGRAHTNGDPRLNLLQQYCGDTLRHISWLKSPGYRGPDEFSLIHFENLETVIASDIFFTIPPDAGPDVNSIEILRTRFHTRLPASIERIGLIVTEADIVRSTLVRLPLSGLGYRDSRESLPNVHQVSILREEHFRLLEFDALCSTLRWNGVACGYTPGAYCNVRGLTARGWHALQRDMNLENRWT